MKTVGSLIRQGPTYKLFGGTRGGGLGEFFRQTSGSYIGFNKEKDATDAARAASKETSVETLQRRQLAEADNQRKLLEQEKASVSSTSRGRRRGRGLTAYSSTMGA